MRGSKLSPTTCGTSCPESYATRQGKPESVGEAVFLRFALKTPYLHGFDGNQELPTSREADSRILIIRILIPNYQYILNS